MRDMAHIFKPDGYWAPDEEIDREVFNRGQEQEIELGLFRMVFWDGEELESFRIDWREFRTLKNK